MKVFKFGGTSVGDSQGLNNIVSIVEKELVSTPVCVVLSAMAKVTDQLEQIGNLAKDGNLKYRKVIDQVESYHKQMVL